MKIRNDYVTNSSSSSFVLAFKNQEHLREFRHYCNEMDYELFYEYVKDWIKKPNDEEKKKIVEELRRHYEYGVCDKQSKIEKHVPRDNYKDWGEYIAACKAYEESEEFKTWMHNELQKTDFYKRKKRINKAEYIINEMIWDTNGGLMEWTIRNGFIEREMWKYCIYVWNIG